jgi:hypothetical protein
MVRVKKAKVDQLYSYEYRSGERWLTLNREDAATIPIECCATFFGDAPASARCHDGVRTVCTAAVRAGH